MKSNFTFLKLFFLVFLYSASCVNSFAQSAKRFLNDGMEAAEKKMHTDAIDYFNKCLMLNPNYYEAFLERGKSFEALGNISEATKDYQNAMANKINDEEPYLQLGYLFLNNKKYVDALIVSKKSIELKKKSFRVYQLLAECKLYNKDFKGASESIEKAISEQKNEAFSWYLKTIIQDSLNLKSIALESAKKANDLLVKSNEYKESKTKPVFLKYFVSLANQYYANNQPDECIAISNKYLIDFPDEALFYYYRGLSMYQKMKMTNALDDLTIALTKNDKDSKIYSARANLFIKLGQTESALGDFIKAISLNKDNSEAIKGKGKCLEVLQRLEEASVCYELALSKNKEDAEAISLVNNIRQKLFESKRERNAPEIYLEGAISANENVCNIPRNIMFLEIKGVIKDQSRIKSISITDEEVKFDSTVLNPTFTCKLKTLLKEDFIIRVEDVYSNVTEKKYVLKRSENEPPVITMDQQFNNERKEIIVSEAAGYMVKVSGNVKDENNIKSIKVNTKSPSFSANSNEIDFSTEIDLVGVDSIIINAIDVFDNVSRMAYKVKKSSETDSTLNPMGKTWAIFVDNSNYKFLPVLEATTNDVKAMNSILENYSIDNIIVKKDLTKAQMDKFFQIELRDLVAENNVNSIMIWFAGHGKFLNESGYWLPIDANKKEEYTFFALSQLKSYLATYKKVKHTLVVSDACETGPAFYLAMRDINANRNCGEWESTKLKSAQVISSTTLDLNDDKSVFTKSFVDALKGVNDKCISIEKISEKVSATAKQNQKPKPKLGNIQGLQDENGTFFFIKKGK
ncbi:MAG: caspase family protein [Bacteroidota bacterium]